jgi:hypothetical protein
VQTPTPGGGTSSAVTFTILGPTLTVQPPVATPGGTLTVTLTNGLGGATDWLGFTTTGAADTTYLTWVYVGAGLATRTWQVTVPATIGLSYEFRLYANDGYVRLATSPPVAVVNPVPTISALSPGSIMAGSGASTLGVSGTGFVAGSVVQFDGTDRTTTFGSTGTLSVALPAGDLTGAGTHTIRVVNPSPGGGASAGATLNVPAPSPVLGSLSPSSVGMGSGATGVTLTGTGFIGTSVGQFDGSNRPTTVVSATQLNVLLTTSDAAVSGQHALTVQTPAPGGGTSSALPFMVVGPTLTANPLVAPPGGAVTVTLTNGLGGATDWLALAASGAPSTSYIVWRYVGSGLKTTTWTVQMPTTAGSYEFRLFAADGYTLVTASPRIAVAVP